MANAIEQAALKLAFEQIDYHEPDDFDDGPLELLVAWPEAHYRHNELKDGHGVAPGHYNSPFDNDTDFKIVVFAGQHAIRVSKYTPDCMLRFHEGAISGMTGLEEDEYLYSMTGIYPQLETYVKPWVSVQPPRRRNEKVERRTMNNYVLEFATMVVMGFTYQVRPTLIERLLQIAATQAKPTWCECLEDAATALARSYDQNHGQQGFGTRTYRKMLARFGSEYANKIATAPVSLNYQFENVLQDNTPFERLVGVTQPWSNGRIVPFKENSAARRYRLQIFDATKDIGAVYHRDSNLGPEFAEDIEAGRVVRLMGDTSLELIHEFLFGITVQEELEAERGQRNVRPRRG